MQNFLPSFSRYDDSDYRSFTTIEASDNDSQSDFDQTIQMPTSNHITLDSLYTTNSVPKLIEFQIPLQTNPTSQSTAEPCHMATGATPKNLQQQQNKQYQNVQIQNVFTNQPHFKRCSYHNKNQNMLWEKQPENSFETFDHHHGVQNHRFSHSDYSSTGLGEIRANFRTQNQDNIETVRNPPISDNLNKKNFQWNIENQCNFKPLYQENSMQQNFNYLNQIQAKTNLFPNQINQRNNEYGYKSDQSNHFILGNNGNRLPSKNFNENINDSNHLSIVAKQLDFPKSYSLNIYSFQKKKNFIRKQKLNKSSKKIYRAEKKHNKNEFIDIRNHEPKVKKSLPAQAATNKSPYNFMSHVICTKLPRMIEIKKFDSVIEELMPDQNLENVRVELRNELTSIKKFEGLFDWKKA